MMQRSTLVTLSLGLGTFLALFDVTAVVVALPGIAKNLGFSVSGVAWVIDAYSLAFTGALLASGVLADRFGRRRALLTGNVIFLIASIGCGVAPTGADLLAFRAIQGAGAAFMVTGTSALVASNFPDRGDRSRAFGVLGVVSGIAMALGPTLGGVLASWFGWPWIFYANVPFCLALAIAVPRIVDESRSPETRQVDVRGIVLLSVALCLVVDALLRKDASIAARSICAAAGALAGLLFVLHQRRSPYPVLEPRVFAKRAMLGVGALLLALQFGYWAVLVYLPLFITAALGVSLEVAGATLLAATLPMLLIPLIGSRFATDWGWRRYCAIAFAIMSIGDGLLIVATVAGDADLRLAAAFAGMVTIGTGAALINPQMSGVALALAPPTHAGVTVAAAMIVRQAGFVISIAMLGAVLASTSDAAAFFAPFVMAALGAGIGLVAALVLLPPHDQ
jgi:MFS family permease